MARLKIALALIFWSAAVGWFLFYWIPRDLPLPPCDDVNPIGVPVCTAPSPVVVEWSYVAVAVAVWVSGILVGITANARRTDGEKT